MSENQSYRERGSKAGRTDDPRALIGSTTAHSVAAEIIWTVRTSELVYQHTERERRLRIRKVLNQAIDRKQKL